MEDNKYDLVGINGNAYSIMGYVQKAMQEQNFSKEDINNYLSDAKSDDYNHLLQVSISMVDKCNERANGNDLDFLNEPKKVR